MKMMIFFKVLVSQKETIINVSDYEIVCTYVQSVFHTNNYKVNKEVDHYGKNSTNRI
jgi:hypothetical protein